jgi:cytochrome c oxidase subunit 2
MQTRALFHHAVPASVAALAIVLAACGSGDDSASGDGDDPVSRGRDLAEDRGCMSCHQEEGGGIGPDWAGLAGSTVTLDDGSTVVADEAYLTLAITDPDAQIVEDYDIRMPSNRLDDDEVAAIVAYIQSLGDTPESPS